MEEQRFVFQVDHPKVKHTFNTQNNYLIEYSDKTIKNCEEYCILYFSSNDIYYPNTPESFEKQLLQKNRFEWYGTRILKGVKHIFLRDIYKQWYLKGINQELSSIEKISNWLKIETEGYKVITVGSSAGGYAAVLFGQLLGAETILTFNGQFNLNDLLKNSNEQLNPIVFREALNNSINKYYQLSTHIVNPESVFYFFSKDSKWDIEQFNSIESERINVIAFKTSHHGIPILKSNLPFVLNQNNKQLEKFSQSVHHPLFFSIAIEGMFATLISIVKQLYKVVVKKINQIILKKSN